MEIINTAMTWRQNGLAFHHVKQMEDVSVQVFSPLLLYKPCVLCLGVSIKSWKLVYFFIRLWYLIVMIDYFSTDMYVYKLTCYMLCINGLVRIS